MGRLSRCDHFAVVLSLLAVLAALFVTERIFEAIPHLEDEIAYVWQANVLANGQLSVPTPDYPKSFLVPFVVDHEGKRFGKYPLGWPVVLAMGVLLDVRWLVNPLLAGLGAWLTYQAGKLVFTEKVSVIAAGLLITSPFFLMNSGSLLSHPLGLVLTAAFVWSWLKGFGDRLGRRTWSYTLAAAFLLGALVLTRPFTALAIAVPFGLHGAYLFLRGAPDPHLARQIRLHLLVLAVLVVALGLLHFAWQYAVTGDPFLNPYTLWWEYDKVGFGPGHGHREQGHTLRQAYINTRHSLEVGAEDLFGWGRYSWIFLPFGIWAVRRSGKAWLVASIFPVLVIFYLAYWVGSSLFGPRYYYEALLSLTLFTGAGIAWLAGWQVLLSDLNSAVGDNDLGSAGTGPELTAEKSSQARRGKRVPAWLLRGLETIWARRAGFVMGIVALLIVYNLVFFAPARLGEMYDLYGMSRADLEPFLTPSAQELTPALIIVHPDRWMPYGVLLDLQDPFLTTPFIFIYGNGGRLDEEIAATFPDRNVYHYYPDEPYTFYLSQKPEAKEE